MAPIIKTGIVLAAGFGSRLRPLTENTPKPLLPVKGKLMLDHAIDKLLEVGIRKIIVNTHYHAPLIHAHLQKYKNSDVEICISHESDLLDVGGGIMNAMQKFALEPLLIINSDVLLEGSLQHLLDAWQAEKMEAILLLQEAQDASKGDFDLADDGKIIRRANGGRYIWTGVSIMVPEIFAGYYLHKFHITKILFNANGENFANYKYYGCVNHTKWLDIGSISNYEYANNSW